MKKINFIYALIICLLIFPSCSKNDDDKVELSVIGGWTVDESKLNGEIVTDQSFVRLLTADNRTEFRFFDNSGLRFERGNWEINGSTLTIDFDNDYMGTKIFTVTDIQPSSMTWESEIPGEGTLKEILTR